MIQRRAHGPIVIPQMLRHPMASNILDTGKHPAIHHIYDYRPLACRGGY